MTGELLRRSATAHKVDAAIKSTRWLFILVCLFAVSSSRAFAARDKNKKSDTKNPDSDKSKDEKDKKEQEEEPKLSVTEHTITIGRKPVKYKATAGGQI
jgi:carboxypeptidase C (cathepsin A)